MIERDRGMTNKVILGALILIYTLGICCGCNSQDKVNSIADISYDNDALEHEIYILENDQYVPYIVISNNYNGSVLLLRKEVLSTPRSVSEYSSLYPDSEIDNYLNTEYLTTLCEIQDKILNTELQVTTEDSLGISGDQIETITRKVFLLSCTEVNINSENMAVEGKTLEYFKDSNNRVAYNDGVATSWWLRTPNTYYVSCVYVIGGNSKVGSTNAYDKNGGRPAFCVSASTQVELRNDIIKGKSVYLLVV